MEIANINFPRPLLNALRDNELVVFAGAGVSMGEPACLPNFEHLAKRIAQGTGKTLRCEDPIDHFLGRLQHEGVKVHDRAAEVLSRDGLESTELHRNLLRLYSEIEQVRIVTTNFDLLFEQAADDLFGSVPEVFRAPALPLGHRFKGIVHVHGAINPPDEHGVISPPDEMVITDLDFGRAYLNEGWARRFLVELFGSFTILFVGYSHNDTIMNYLARALPARETDRRFALTGGYNNDADHWNLLGIEPITYPQSNKDDHNSLDGGVRGLAALAQRSFVDWHRKITEIAETPPPLDKETEDLIEYALADVTKVRFFTKAATSPEWIDWLDEHEYFTPLFGDSTLNRRDKIFSWWLIEQFAYTHANKLFLLIGKYNMHLHPDFWHDLIFQIGVYKKISWDKDVLARWISLLLATVQERIGAADRVHAGTDILLQLLGERCLKHGMLDSFLQIFDVMMGSRSRIRKGHLLPNGDEDSERSSVDMKLSLIGGHRVLEEMWTEGLKPELPQVAEALLHRVIRRLEDWYITLCAWQKADRNRDPTSDSRSAIETHEQNRPLQGIDVLIDAARDCLEWLISNQVDVAVQWCNWLVCSDAPLLRRLAIHGLSKREELTADSKIDWLLTHIDLHERPVRHEVFRVVRLIYPEANPECRQVFIRAVRAYRWPNEEHSRKEEYAAEQHFDWFDWLHKSDPNCRLARQALDKVVAGYPNLKPKEYSNPRDWVFSDWEAPQSPWSPEELLAKPAADWLDDLLSFQVTEWDGLDRKGLIGSIAEAIRRDCDWGLDLAKALDRSEKWDVYLWPVLIDTWSRMELDEEEHSQVLSWLGKTELYPKHSRKVANALYALVEPSGPSYVLNLLPQANKIAAALWHDLNRTEPIEEWNDYQDAPSSHPAGSLVNFWLSGLSFWRDQQVPKPTEILNEYRRILTRIVKDQSVPGRLGRMILAGQFGNLLDFDEIWTQKNLLPLFAPHSDDFYAAWAGFLTQGDLNPAVVEVMVDPFLNAVERINSDCFNERDLFIERYIYIFTSVVEDPLDKWIPEFFRFASQETKDCFAAKVDFHLGRMTEAERQEWWERWLKRYWKNRLQGVPAGEPESGEIAHMLNWLRHLTVVFSEAAGFAIQMPAAALRNCWIIQDLNESNLWQQYPELVADLLIYVWKCDPTYTRSSRSHKLIDKLLPLDLSPKRKRELEAIKIQL